MNEKRLNLIVADDQAEISQQIASMSSRILLDLGYEAKIFSCKSGSEVLELSSQEAPDILIIDYHFESGMSGADVLSRLPDYFNDIYIVLISGREESELSSVINTLQSQDRSRRFSFVRKPIDKLVLRSRLIDAIRFLKNRPLPFPVAYAGQRFESEKRALNRLTGC